MERKWRVTIRFQTCLIIKLLRVLTRSSLIAIGLHPVYLAAAIGFGAQCCNWMNDSGFWIFAKMSGLTEVETLKTWTVTVSIMAVISLFVTVLFASVLPLV